MVMGTAGYMSPEQAQGKVKKIDHRSDIFSFGCILFEAVTGQRPFTGESFIDSLHKVVYEAAPPIKDFNPSAPPDLQRIVRRCLAKDPDERYQTIKDVALELKEVRQVMGQRSLIPRCHPQPPMRPTPPYHRTNGDDVDIEGRLPRQSNQIPQAQCGDHVGGVGNSVVVVCLLLLLQTPRAGLD
jgi:serine/threonine protein kinase